MAVSPLMAGTVPLFVHPAVLGTAASVLVALHASAAACGGCRQFATQLVVPLELKRGSSLSRCILTCRLDYEGLCKHLMRTRMGKTFVPTGSDNVAITGVPTLFIGRQADAKHPSSSDF